jgi:hypothetical protein
MIKVDVQTSTRRLLVAMVRRRTTATTHPQVDRTAAVKTKAGSTGSRPVLRMIIHLLSQIDRVQVRIVRVQVHNRPVIAADGSASLPTPVDARTITLLDAEMTAAANRSWN